MEGKTEQRKARRIFTPEWVGHLARTLSPSGRLYISSDVREYFEEIQALVSGCPGFRLLNNPGELMEGAGYVPSNFEVKMAKAGHPTAALFTNEFKSDPLTALFPWGDILGATCPFELAVPAAPQAGPNNRVGRISNAEPGQKGAGCACPP